MIEVLLKRNINSYPSKQRNKDIDISIQHYPISRLDNPAYFTKNSQLKG